MHRKTPVLTKTPPCDKLFYINERNQVIPMKDKHTLKWLYSRAKGQLPVVFLLSLMRSALTVLGVVFALTSRYVVDAAVARDASLLSHNALKLLLIIAAQISIRLIGQWIESSITAKLNIRIRSHLFSAILRRDYSAQSAYHSGDLMTRLDNDSGIVSSGIISLIPSVIALVVGLSYALFSLMRLDINFAFIFLFGGIILLIVISAFRGVMKKLHKNVQEAESKVRAFYQE
jgi:ATP-binding cassette subfamily B protein